MTAPLSFVCTGNKKASERVFNVLLWPKQNGERGGGSRLNEGVFAAERTEDSSDPSPPLAGGSPFFVA